MAAVSGSFAQPPTGLDSAGIIADLMSRVERGDLTAGDKFPTSRELCRLYGVSPNTMSRCIAHLKRLGLVTARVGAGIYVADAAAHAAQHQAPGFTTTTFVVRILRGREERVTDYLSRIYDNAVLGIQDESASLNMRNGAVIVPESMLVDDATLTAFIARHVADSDGVYFVGLVENLIDRLEKIVYKPSVYVVAQRMLPVRSNIYSIDMYRCARAVIDHLHDQGYQRIACITGGMDKEGRIDRGYQWRMKAFEDAASERGLELDPSLIYPSTESDVSIREAAARLISLPEDERPDAVFCFNDLRALILLETARAAGMVVPDDIAIAGFDGSRQALQAGITTIELPFYAIGRNAACGMQQLLNGALAGPVSSTFATGLMRGRTA